MMKSEPPGLLLEESSFIVYQTESYLKNEREKKVTEHF